ncbi:MAG: ATP-binding protein [Candidatus Poribacteria bacterium]|nr:ATP-binding protein [Candidatus Poribacteria bacterium]
MSTQQSIEVTSHVARDFLQNAAYFNTMPKVVWEYVANSLDAAKDGIVVVIAIEITSHDVRISDNSCGMSREELGKFFQMHGENILRKQGKKVRGRFGTGKCAAFGLADSFRIDTIQAGSRNVVELHREDIERAQNGEPFSVRDIEVNQSTHEDDGTIVIIRELNIKRPNINKVISYLERHLSRYRTRARVAVNGHVCKFEEPPFIKQFKRFPPIEIAKLIGNVSLNVKVSPVPLDDDTRGIDILSYGIWHETTLAGIERKENANHIFGQIDVPILEDGEWSIPAFDNTRNNTLNRQNPIVVVLLGWLSKELEKIRSDFVRQAREERRSEIQAKLVKEAEKISDILNQDFAQQEIELELAQRVSKRFGNRSVNEILNGEGELLLDSNDVQTPRESDEHTALGNVSSSGSTARRRNKQVGKKRTVKGGGNRQKAVFSIEFEHFTAGQNRSRYDGNTKTIFINLDHPQIANAFETGGNTTSSRQFREICYEVAAVEYAIALPYEKLEKDELYHAEDALFDVRDTIDRVTKSFVQVLVN